jgi:hypothetical protein
VFGRGCQVTNDQLLQASPALRYRPPISERRISARALTRPRHRSRCPRSHPITQAPSRNRERRDASSSAAKPTARIERQRARSEHKTKPTQRYRLNPSAPHGLTRFALLQCRRSGTVGDGVRVARCVGADCGAPAAWRRALCARSTRPHRRCASHSFGRQSSSPGRPSSQDERSRQRGATDGACSCPVPAARMRGLARDLVAASGAERGRRRESRALALVLAVPVAPG